MRLNDADLNQFFAVQSVPHNSASASDVPRRVESTEANQHMMILTATLTATLNRLTLVTRPLLLVLAASVLAGCASNSQDEALSESLSEAELYQMSTEALNDDRYMEAIKSLRTLESRYPFGSFAEQTQLDIIYAYFKNGEPEAAKAAADRFIRLHPQHPDADYAYYMKGLASNTASMGLLERYLPLDQSRRDPGQSRLSFNDFAELLSRYPNSPYGPDARQRMVALRNRLAEYEIHAGNYYLKRKAYVAAINRGRYVVENMEQTTAVPEALAIMIEGYRHLQLPELAAQTLEVLKLNYPNHPSLDSEGNFVGYKVFDDVDPSIWSTLTFGLIGGKSRPELAPVPKPPQAD